MVLVPTDSSPDHSSLAFVRDRLPLEVHQRVVLLILQLAGLKEFLKGIMIGVAATIRLASLVNQQCEGVIRRINHRWIAIYVPMFAEETKAFGVSNR